MHPLLRHHHAIGVVVEARSTNPSREYGFILFDEIGDVGLCGRTDLLVEATMQCIAAGPPVLAQIAGMCDVQKVGLQAQFGGEHLGMVDYTLTTVARP